MMKNNKNIHRNNNLKLDRCEKEQQIILSLTARKFSQMRQFSKSHLSASWYVATARGLQKQKSKSASNGNI